MKVTTLVPLATAAAAAAIEKRDQVYGFDVSHYQGASVDFTGAYNNGGLRFVYIKATQGTTYTDPTFSQHYEDATNAGFIRGGYHFASGTGDGSQEADFFIQNGGGWTGDGRTLPGMLDLEGNCIDTDWISTFSNTYYNSEGVYPVIYTSPSWWEDCTGNSNQFVNTNPLMVAQYTSASSPDVPGGWPYYTIWQYADSNPYGGDSDVFNGDMSQLQAFATGPGSSSSGAS